MREMPNATFIELPCGEALAQSTLLEITLAIERADLACTRGEATAMKRSTCRPGSDWGLKANG